MITSNMQGTWERTKKLKQQSNNLKILKNGKIKQTFLNKTNLAFQNFNDIIFDGNFRFVIMEMPKTRTFCNFLADSKYNLISFNLSVEELKNANFSQGTLVNSRNFFSNLLKFQVVQVLRLERTLLFPIILSALQSHPVK